VPEVCWPHHACLIAYFPRFCAATTMHIANNATVAKHQSLQTLRPITPNSRRSPFPLPLDLHTRHLPTEAFSNELHSFCRPF